MRLCTHFGVASLAGFGCEKLCSAISAAGALLNYLEETQKNSLAHIRKISVLRRTLYMGLDASTRRNLELTQPLRFEGSKKSTLLYLLDKTATAMGARLLRAWLEQPLQNMDDINARLDAVEELFKNSMRGRRCAARSIQFMILNGSAAASHMARFMPVTAMPCALPLATCLKYLRRSLRSKRPNSGALLRTLTLWMILLRCSMQRLLKALR